MRMCMYVRPRLHYRRLTLCPAPTARGRELPAGDAPSPALSPTDPVPRGLLTLCPGLHTWATRGEEECFCALFFLPLNPPPPGLELALP